MAETIILSGFPKPQKDYYKVYVCTITFNQASYIGDCLNGVAIQQTDFPFVHHVIDDCSTDGEQEVIKTYLNNNCDMDNAEYYDNDVCSITIAKNRFNPNCTLVVYFLKKNMYRNPEKRKLLKTWRDVSLYEAICEGDDYWIDEHKLRKQYDFLETHKDYYLHATNVRAFYQKTGIYKDFFLDDKQYDDNYNIDDYLAHMPTYILPCGWLIRKEVFAELPTKYMMADLPVFLNALSLGKIHFENVISAFYRILPQSACHFTNYNQKLKFSDSAFECKMFYAKMRSNDVQKKLIVSSIKNIFALAIVCQEIRLIKKYRHLINQYNIYDLKIRFLMLSSSFKAIAILYKTIYLKRHN